MKTPRTWCVITDGGRARILKKRKDRNIFDSYREFMSPAIHRPTRDLGTERPGRTFASANPARHAIQPRNDFHRAAKDAFVRKVAREINLANSADEFDLLILVAPAHALLTLEKTLNTLTRRKVAFKLQKDLTKVPDADLAAHFKGMRLNKAIEPQ